MQLKSETIWQNIKPYNKNYFCTGAVAEECVGIPEERQHISDEGCEHDTEIHFQIRGKEQYVRYVVYSSSVHLWLDNTDLVESEAYLGALRLPHSPLEVQKLYYNLMWKKTYAKFWTLLKMYTCNVPPLLPFQISKYATALRRHKGVIWTNFKPCGAPMTGDQIPNVS